MIASYLFKEKIADNAKASKKRPIGKSIKHLLSNTFFWIINCAPNATRERRETIAIRICFGKTNGSVVSVKNNNGNAKNTTPRRFV